MSQRSDGKLTSLEDVSALLDGELDGSDPVGRACAQWRDDASARESWHTWHLIGDVLRSDDLATSPARDNDFLAALRTRLAAEPVVLAPQADLVPDAVADVPAVANGTAARRGWRTPVAIAAGFAVVASVLVVTRLPGPVTSPASSAEVLARTQAVPGPALASTSVGGASNVPGTDRANDGTVVVDGRLIRDARLDDYLAAHKKFGGSSGPGGPSGYLRNAAVEGR